MQVNFFGCPSRLSQLGALAHGLTDLPLLLEREGPFQKDPEEQGEGAPYPPRPLALSKNTLKQ